MSALGFLRPAAIAIRFRPTKPPPAATASRSRAENGGPDPPTREQLASLQGILRNPKLTAWLWLIVALLVLWGERS